MTNLLNNVMAYQSKIEQDNYYRKVSEFLVEHKVVPIVRKLVGVAPQILSVEVYSPGILVNRMEAELTELLKDFNVRVMSDSNNERVLILIDKYSLLKTSFITTAA